MAKLLTFEALGYRDVAGRMARRSTELVQAQRDEMRELGRAGVSTIRHYAPEDTGKFKAGIRYRTTDTGKGTTLAFYASGEHAYLLPFLTEGTPPHEIPVGGAEVQKAKGYPLHWVDESGEDHYAWSVFHPGTLPDPFMALAMDALSPQMSQAASRIARRVVWLS
jgi:hypothetical protein